MKPASKTDLKRFEAQLDAALAARPTMAAPANLTLMLAANIAEVAAAQEPASSLASALNDGIVTFAAHLVSGRDGAELDVEPLAKDLMFGRHYHLVRDLLYYSYNAPGSIAWTFTPERVDIRFADPSLPRQFFTTWNEHVLGSLAHFEGRDGGETIVAGLKGAPEFEVTPALEALESLIEAEVDHKLQAYFTILDPTSAVDLGGYRYDQAFAVYRQLMILAMYHRYQARANDNVGAVYFTRGELEAALVDETQIELAVIDRILKDLAFDQDAVEQRLDASYFSLFKEGGAPHRFVLRPHHFALSEGLVQLLRVVASRRPQTFLANVSNPLGARFVARIAAAFEADGFTCHSEVSLRHIDPTLPDIDLLVLSHEPTLGYVLFVCEVKSPLPPLWGKDQLRVLAPDSVSKAFRQVEAIRRVLGTSEGVSLLRSFLPEKPLEHFDGFVIVLKQMIITSDNAGMFFGHEETPILSFRTLERLLKRSDGDILHIMECIRTYNDGADSTLGKATESFDMAGVEVTYEGVTCPALMVFPDGDWRTSCRREQVIASFVAGGHHPFDCLEERDGVLIARPADAAETDADDPSDAVPTSP